MKRKHIYILNSTLSTMILVLFFVFKAAAQDNFQVKWSMDYTQAGVSNHANFTPSDANLLGGPNAYGLPSIYSPGGAIVVGYIIRPWPIIFSAARCMEFSFTANSFKYNINSISFRLRRSPTGPKEIKLRTIMDGFSSDLFASTLTNGDVFYSFSVPVSFNNLTNNTFSFRIYGYNPSNQSLGVLWFDEIIVNGEVLLIILPIDLTYFKAEKQEKQVNLSWETAWEKNSKEFIVERSADLQVFEPIGTLQAAGDASGRLQYEFTDQNPGAGVNYYRLRMIDQDNSFSFSKTLDVITEQELVSLYVVPNPASPEKITIVGTDLDFDQLALTSSTGASISCRFESIGTNLIHLYPPRPLKSGLYLLTYQKNGRKEHVKILVP